MKTRKKDIDIITLSGKYDEVYSNNRHMDNKDKVFLA